MSEVSRNKGTFKITKIPKLIKCTFKSCSRQFQIKSNLIIHMRTHTGVRPYCCLKCKKTFISQGNLTTHLRTHTGEKPYKCHYENCDQAYSRSHRLNAHLRKHTGQKPFKCPYCDKYFNEKGNLKTHLRIHTGERPFKCPYENCQSYFKTHGNVNSHAKLHTKFKPFNCNTCNLKFWKSSALEKHMKKHLKKNSTENILESKGRNEPHRIKNDEEKQDIVDDEMDENQEKVVIHEFPDDDNENNSDLIINQDFIDCSIERTFNTDQNGLFIQSPYNMIDTKSSTNLNSELLQNQSFKNYVKINSFDLKETNENHFEENCVLNTKYVNETTAFRLADKLDCQNLNYNNINLTNNNNSFCSENLFNSSSKVTYNNDLTPCSFILSNCSGQSPSRTFNKIFNINTLNDNTPQATSLFQVNSECTTNRYEDIKNRNSDVESKNNNKFNASSFTEMMNLTKSDKT